MKFPPFSRRTVIWIAAGLSLYGIFLATYLPASWVAQLLARATQQRINLVAPTGTIWAGQGALVINLPGSGPTRFGTLTWDLRILSFFLAQLRADIQLRDGPIALESSIIRSFGELRVQALHGRASASQLADLYPPLGAANLKGEFQIDAESVRFARQGLSAQANLTWQNAGSGNFGLDNLGDYRATLSGDAPPVRIDIATLRGDVTVTGDGQWSTTPDGRLQLSLTIDPKKRQSSLGPLLQSWTQPVDNGRYRYEITTALPLPHPN